MSLHKIKDFDPDYRQHFGDRDILKFDIYSGTEKVGSVDDLLVDDAGQFRYWVINTGAWIVGKKVLLPIGQSRIDESTRRVYADGLTRDQVKYLPEYNGESIDYDYEERVRGVYRPRSVSGTTSVPATYDRQSYRYDRDPELYNLNDRDHALLRHSQTQMVSGRPTADKHRRSIGVFPNRRAAEQALHELRDSGFPMDRVSVVTRDADQHDNIAGADVRDRVGNKADEGAAIGAVSGGALGGITGLLVGLGTLAIPGIGPVMLAGATATALATTLAGGAIGAVSGSLLGALIGLGIPEERARVYQDRISQGGYLVIVDGTDADIARAETILHRGGIEEYGVYDAPTAHTSTAVQNTPSVVPAAHTAPTHAAPTTYTSTPSQVDRRSAVGFFSNLSDAEHAVTDLRSIGFPLSQISLVANHFQRRDQFADVDLRDRFEATRLGIPSEQAHLYQERLDRGEYMVIVSGTEDELNRAASILNRRRIQEWRMYDPTGGHNELPVEAPRRTTAVTPVASTSGESGVGHLHRAVGFFSRPQDAEQAIAELRSAGFPLEQVSLVAQRFDRREPFTGVDLRDRFDNSRLNFPEERVRTFNDRVGRGDYLVIVRGTWDQLRQAEAILKRAHIDDFEIHEPMNRSSVPVAATPVMASSETYRTGTPHRRAIGVFSHRHDAEAALTELRDTGFPMHQVSLIAKRTEDITPIDGVNIRLHTGNNAGGTTGAVATTPASSATRTATGGLTGGLVGPGIPENRARVYENRVTKGDYLVMIDGTEVETRQAETILQRHNIQEWKIYDNANVDTTRHTAPNVEPIYHDDSRIEQPHPDVAIIDHRDETRL